MNGRQDKKEKLIPFIDVNTNNDNSRFTVNTAKTTSTSLASFWV